MRCSFTVRYIYLIGDDQVRLASVFSHLNILEIFWPTLNNCMNLWGTVWKYNKCISFPYILLVLWGFWIFGWVYGLKLGKFFLSINLLFPSVPFYLSSPSGNCQYIYVIRLEFVPVLLDIMFYCFLFFFPLAFLVWDLYWNIFKFRNSIPRHI